MTEYILPTDFKGNPLNHNREQIEEAIIRRSTGMASLKKKQKHHHSPDEYTRSAMFSNLILLSLGILFMLPIIGYFIFAFVFLHLDDSHNRAEIKLRESWIISHNKELMYIYTDIFPRAKECYQKASIANWDSEKRVCESEIRKTIDDNLSNVLGFEEYEIGRKPIYFIRFKDKDTIEKLFQGGGYFEEKVDTKGERMVIQMLQGKRNLFAYPQYNCCGGNDFVPEIPIFNLFLPTRIYLKDFYTEIEHIFLLRDDENRIVGGLVYLYGD